jgi:phosphoribosylaminoimidazole carboxylase (NCAIR synthetase)
LLAVEMFLDKNGKMLVNELAPRPHNSGHQTIEGNVVSQFEQHLSAIFNQPLGDTSLPDQRHNGKYFRRSRIRRPGHLPGN